MLDIMNQMARIASAKAKTPYINDLGELLCAEAKSMKYAHRNRISEKMIEKKSEIIFIILYIIT